MFSVSPAEILTIAVVALLVFGPRRLPEIARKAGKVLRDLREAAGDLRSGMEAEYREVVEPLREARDTMQQAITAADRATRPDPAGPGPAPASDDQAAGSAEDPEAPDAPAEDGDGT